jgi:DegV family protein with EDD domain
MARVRIITDATAHLSPDLIAQHQITVLPIEVQFGDQKFVIEPQAGAKRLFQEMAGGPVSPIQASISPRAIHDAYRRLNRETDEVLVVVSSRQLSGAQDTALAEARTFLGRCRIAVTDSMATSWGLGLVVEAAARAAAAGMNLDETVRLVRGLLPHIYAVFFVERLDYLEHGGRIGPAQALLGTILRIKPLLIVEDGDIIPLEKVRTHIAAIEKLADFVTEFAAIQQVVIMRSPLGNSTDELREELNDRLGPILPDLRFPVVEYDPVLACHLGPEALGVTVYEGFGGIRPFR